MSRALICPHVYHHCPPDLIHLSDKPPLTYRLTCHHVTGPNRVLLEGRKRPAPPAPRFPQSFYSCLQHSSLASVQVQSQGHGLRDLILPLSLISSPHTRPTFLDLDTWHQNALEWISAICTFKRLLKIIANIGQFWELLLWDPLALAESRYYW